MAAQTAAASGRDLGDLFEYKLDRPVSIKQNQSALVPILQAQIGADRVSLWSPGGSAGERPLNAVWITNSSPYTLDGGSVTLLDRNTYAGEGLTEPIKPNERRLLSYAVDLAVRVQAQAKEPLYRVSRMRASKGVVISETVSCAERTYTIRNEDASARTVVIEHPLTAGWTLAPGGPQPAETSAAAYRFSLAVDAKKTVTLAVREARADEARFSVSDLGDDQVTGMVRDLGIGGKALDDLRAILAKKGEIAAVDRDLRLRDADRRRHLERPGTSAREHEGAQGEHRGEAPARTLRAAALGAGRPARGDEDRERPAARASRDAPGGAHADGGGDRLRRRRGRGERLRGAVTRPSALAFGLARASALSLQPPSLQGQPSASAALMSAQVNFDARAKPPT